MPSTRIRATLAYDGTDFSGWAKQPGLRTVQGIVEDALRNIAGSHVALTVAGRTDAGVHALAQTVHFDLDNDQRARILRRAPDDELAATVERRLGGVLRSTPDVGVASVVIAPTDFDARFSALWRSYEYRIRDLVVGYSPLDRRTALTVRSSLDVAAMDAAAQRVIGLGDFASFCKPRDGATTIRELFEFAPEREHSGVIAIRLRADAFCHSMVRALVGALIRVGEGRFDADEFARIRDARHRGNGFAVAPAHGLTLTGVGYPDASKFGERAEATRARRSEEHGRS